MWNVNNMNPVKFLRNFKKFNEMNFIFLFFKLFIHIYLFKFYKEKLKCHSIFYQTIRLFDKARFSSKTIF